MFEQIIDGNKYILYLDSIGIETKLIKDKIHSRLNQDENRKKVFNAFGNRVHELTSFNIYVENCIFEELNFYLNKKYKEEIIFEEDVRLDIKTLIAIKNSEIERPNISMPFDLLDGVSQIEKINDFIRIARFENQLIFDNYRIIGNNIIFQGISSQKQVRQLFFDCSSNLIWEDEFLTDNRYKLIGFQKQFHSIEAKYILWIDSALLHMLDLKLENHNHGLLAINEFGETIIQFRSWREDLIGSDMNDNVAKLEGCDLIIREDYFDKMQEIVGELFYITRKIEI